MKTKEQLLRAMDLLFACCEAREWVASQRSSSAEQIGQNCRRPEWLVWLLWRKLTPPSRRLFAKRLGLRRSRRHGSFTFSADHIAIGLRPNVGYHHVDALKLDRRVIDDCWRAWCRSKP